MKVKKLISILEKCNPEAEVKMHDLSGRNLLFAVSYAHDENSVILEDAGDNDLTSELSARFKMAADKQWDELDFFLDLIDTGFTLEDIRENLPEKYEYSRKYMEEHGLI